MEADTFSNAGIIEFANKTLVNVHLRTDKDEELAKKYSVGPIPVTFFLSPEGERLSTWVGYMPPDEYRKTIDKGLTAHKKLVALAPKLKASPEEFALLHEAADLYEELGNGKKAAETLLRAAPRAGDAKAQGTHLIKAFKLFNEADADDEVNKGMLEIADRLDKLDADGKLGFQDDAAYARAMVDFNKEAWDDAIKRLEGIVAKWPEGDKAPEALITLGDLYHHAKHDNAKAEKALKMVVEKYPKSDFVERAKEFLEHMKKHAEK